MEFKYRKYLTWIGYFITILCFSWFVIKIVTTSFDFKHFFYHNIPYLLFSLGLYSTSIFILSIAWHVLLRAIGNLYPKFTTSCLIIFITQIGKYLPGNIGQHFGRVFLAKRYSIEVSTSVFTLLLETFWVVSTGGTIALIAILSTGNSILENNSYTPSSSFLTLLIGIMLLTPFIGHRLFDRLAICWSGRKGIQFEIAQMPSIKTIFIVVLLYGFIFILLGLVLKIIASSIFDNPDGGFLLLTGIFAVAWIAGFITPGSPAGLGVREIVLVAALTPIYSNETAVGITTALRVTTVLGDIIVFFLGLVLARVQKKEK